MFKGQFSPYIWVGKEEGTGRGDFSLRGSSASNLFFLFIYSLFIVDKHNTMYKIKIVMLIKSMLNDVTSKK